MVTQTMGAGTCPQEAEYAIGVKNVHRHDSPSATFPFSGQEEGVVRVKNVCGF